MPVNASPHYLKAEAEYLQAETTAQRIKCLQKMMVLSPKHKSSENLNAQLKRRLAKLKYTKEKEDKSGKSSFKGIKKEDMQAILVGKTNSGKSSILNLLTNAEPKISEIKFTTTEPIIGMMPFLGTQIQLIENPAIDSDFYNKGITHTADTILIIIENLDDISEIEKFLERADGKKILVFNKIDQLNENEKRKIEATLKSKFKKYDFVMISARTKENLEKLKEKIFTSFGKIRVFTKEPGKEKSNKPVILNPNSKVKDVAEKILKGLAKNVKQTKLWGPSSKFPGQQVGLNHILKDLDVVEFRTG